MKELFKATTKSKINDLLKDSRQFDDLINRDEYFTLTNTVTQFRSENSFRLLIEQVLNDRTLLDEILQNSYRHHNGFHKIVLNRGALFKLRLHIFEKMPEITTPMENVHNHRWNFASQIIAGRLKMEIFQPNRDNIENNLFFDYDYKSSNGGNNYEVNLLGLSGLQITEERVFGAGESYYMDSNEMHRIINFQDERVVTIVMTGIPNNSECKLYSKNAFVDDQKEILKYSRNELLRVLESI